MPPKIIDEPIAFQRHCEAVRHAGDRLGLVPTMGALHEGHLSLMRAARRHGADVVATTIFVNPLQFGPGEDLERYPRTFEQDVAACAREGVDIIFAPSAEDMYPSSFATQVSLRGITEVLEGAYRPGHFDGVTTVVSKLFNLAGPSVAVFGKKDYQQFRIIETLARDLCFGIDVRGEPIVREADGLALSSRNRYLSGDERSRALSLKRGLDAATERFERGERDPAALALAARQVIAPSVDRIDYVAVVDRDTLLETASADRQVLLVAAYVGRTRLIDNVELGNVELIDHAEPGGA